MSNKTMTDEDMIAVAQTALEKGWDFETLKYSDDMYGRENLAEDVWVYVEEGKMNGLKWFYETYL